MFFPWVGLFEQIRLADVFVHYDDVQLPQGRSFTTRVQVKGPNGVHWLTMPVKRESQHPNINATCANDEESWRQSHLKTLHHLYAKAPHVREMLAIVEQAYAMGTSNVAELNIAAIENIADYFEIACEFRRSSSMAIPGKSTERLLAITKQLSGTVYITGHGARNYLDHELFEKSSVRVEYMKYNQTEYKQLHGDFTPFVSVIDLIANEGKDGRRLIASSSVYWKEFLS
jgi:WbqC-like protein